MPELSTMTIWLFAGVFFLVLEALGLPGAGLLFAGLGALVAGILISMGLIGEADSLMQFIVFFLATGIWAAILWKPLQKFKTGRQEKKFNNIIGDTAVVGKVGLSDEGGRVKWSGTTMNAQLAKEAAGQSLAPGAKVIITDIEGTTLIVKPK